ncbi:cutinase family protein [Nocardia carnea]|uniref:cutinase family protein n=1 Tax=Nocardia carnea TaxID=37328 RepID=UPI0024566FE5|nr:cutinase family protein [Nocardia carnea]
MTSSALAAADVPHPVRGSCPALMVLGVQGTSESSPTADAFADSGMLGHAFVPMLAAGASIARAYVPYPASFGGAPLTGPGLAPFADSVAAGLANLNQMAAATVGSCANTRLAVAGFSGGAAVASAFAEAVGAGHGAVPADRVAGVALISNPARRAGSGPLPGRPGQAVPSAAPGAAGVATSRIHLPPVPPTGGIAEAPVNFGALGGRVGEFCVPGDLACDAPANAAGLHAVAALAAQADLRDPVAAFTSLLGLLSHTLGETRTAIVLHDIQLQGGRVDYMPTRSASWRWADAADPRMSGPSPADVHAAVVKEGQIGAAIVADPLGQLPRLIGQIGAAITQNAADNAGLLDPAVLLRYANLVTNHAGYATGGQTQQVAAWFTALAQDLAGTA